MTIPRSPGTVLRRLRWPVVIAWVLALVLLHPLAADLATVTDDTTSAYLPSSAPSTRVAELQKPVRSDRSATVAVVFTRRGGLTSGDLATIAAARTSVARLAGPAGPAERSADGEAAAFRATAADDSVVTAIRRAVRSPATGLRVLVSGEAAVNADSGGQSQTTLLLTAVVIVALVLLVVYRSVVLWVFPLFGAASAIIIAQAAAHGLASAGLTVSSLSTGILIVLVFGAASDYALLLIHRYREELRHHDTTEDAMAAALRRTLPTLAASAATVIGAMLALLAARSASLHGLGPVGAVGIVSALLAQTTLLPALLLIAGRRAFWPRTGRAGGESSRLWSAVGARTARRPAVVAVASVVLLGAAAVGLAALHTDNDPLNNLEGRPDSVTGARLISQHYGAGAIAPLVLLTPPGSAAAAATAAVRSTPSVARVSPAAPVRGYAAYSVTLSVPPFDARGYAAVAGLRASLRRVVPGALVGGESAVAYDTMAAAHRDTLVLIPLVLLVILVVVAALLRAVVAPLLLVAATALSFAASFGVSVLVWRHVLGFSGVEAQLPLYIFVFLVALGVDYNIFLSARIREETGRLGTRQGTLYGLSVTGGVITAAGVVLAATFAALAQQDLVTYTEVGTAIAFGVLLDTLLVRTVMIPAALLTLGERAWWPSMGRGSVRSRTRRAGASRGRRRSGLAGPRVPSVPPTPPDGRGR
ncbi:MMPL family transporter [Actinomadura sp. DC4]|uniref:MMPL family transporter n=1 Tax=Actinomadura sp. DC4 TaxID=3055069 RepID=UPI0025B096A3|nr:MMPL family transporter [Actinomadura sp. DC4]MDN3360095.1 MMPL family transporter [Actinomadura sp. DC4]